MFNFVLSLGRNKRIILIAIAYHVAWMENFPTGGSYNKYIYIVAVGWGVGGTL